MITFETAREIAARIWLDPEYSHVVMDALLADTIAELLHAHEHRMEESVNEAIIWLIADANGDLTAGELRQQVIERFGVKVDAELARRFGRHT